MVGGKRVASSQNRFACGGASFSAIEVLNGDLDFTVRPKPFFLRLEGRVYDLTHRLNTMRKEDGLAITDRIVLTDMTFQARHGVGSWEKVQLQRFEIDVELQEVDAGWSLVHRGLQCRKGTGRHSLWPWERSVSGLRVCPPRSRRRQPSSCLPRCKHRRFGDRR